MCLEYLYQMLLIYVSEPKNRFFVFNPNLKLLQSSSSASWEGKAIHEALHIGHVSAKYFNLNIYALHSLKHYSFSVFSIIPHFLQSPYFPSHKSVLWVWSESVIWNTNGLQIQFPCHKDNGCPTASFSCSSFCPNSIGYAEDEDNLYSAFTISPRLLRWGEGKGRLKRHEGKGTSRHQYIT